MKRSAQIQIELEKQLAESANFISKLDATIEQFLNEAPALEKRWMEAEVPRAVQRRPEVVKRLGKEGLGKLKAKLNELYGRLPHLTKEALGSKEHWPHYRPWTDHEKRLADFSKQSDQFLEGVYREVVSSLGSTLDEYELLGNTGPHEAWKRVPGAFLYTSPLMHENPIANVSGTYEALLRRYRSHLELIAQTKASLERAEAQELFDQS